MSYLGLEIGRDRFVVMNENLQTALQIFLIVGGLLWLAIFSRLAYLAVEVNREIRWQFI